MTTNAKARRLLRAHGQPDAVARAHARRAEAVALREDAADRREEAVERREDAADRREEPIDRRREPADRRDDGATMRERVLRAADETTTASPDLDDTEARLREANERLVIAAVQAQTMTETAEQVATQMAYLAEHDVLTGLPNRAVLSERLSQAITLAERRGKKVALMFLDLDHFKQVNDSLGHTMGDRLLQSVAARLKTCVGQSDTLSRQGGDEFVVLLPEIDTIDEAMITADKLIAVNVAPHLIGDHQVYVTLSIGVSLYPDDGHDAETTVRNADNAMYHAKRNGRDNCQVFTPTLKARVVERQSTRDALERALERRELVLHYQPAVNLVTGVITGAEALLRLQGVDQALVYPAKFVATAEDSGLILPIGSWVLREACRQIQAWRLTGLHLGQIAVNVSANELRSKGFLAGVRAVLTETGLNPSHLELEFTERGLGQDGSSTRAALRALRELGVRIAIDDFGTGWLGLSKLRGLPIDTLKLDRSLVQDLDGRGGMAVTSAFIALGISLEHRVVAEGVETKRQLAFLRSRHCGEGQGYYFSRPVAAGAFAALLAVNRA